MWNAYVRDNLKNDRSSGAGAAVCAFFCALMLSLLCGLLYNMWSYDVERVKAEWGDVHGRIDGPLSREQLSAMEAYDNVEAVVPEGEAGRSSRRLRKKAERRLRQLQREPMGRFRQLASG